MTGEQQNENAKLTPTRRNALKLAAGTAVGTTLSPTSVTAQAVAEGSTLYVGRDDGLHAVNVDTGIDEWVFEQELAFIYSSPTVADGTVYIGGRDETLYAIDAATGEQNWAYTEPSHEIRSSPTIVDGTVFVGGSPFGDGTVHAVDATTGEQDWIFNKPNNGADASPNVVNGAVYISGNNGTVYSIDAETGQENWSYEFADAQIDSRPTVANGTVYIGTAGFRLIAIDANSGEEQWSVDEYSGVISAPTVVNGTVYAGAGPYNDAGPLFAVNAATGEVEWEFSTPDGIRRYGGPTVFDGIVYVGTAGGELYAVDAETGEQEWVFSKPSRAIKSGPTTFANRVYFVTNAAIYAVNVVTGEQEWVLDVDGGSRSSPTFVQDPEEGDSVGSRVNLGTLGHTDFWAAKSTADSTITINNVGTSAWKVTAIDGDAARVPLNENNPQIGLEVDKRYLIVNNGWSAHPFELRDTGGEVLLSQDQGTTGSFEDNAAVEWVNNGDELVFTLTEALAEEIASYICAVHNSMQGAITVIEDPLEKYRNQNGEVTDTGLLEAISDWRDGELEDTQLLQLISEWREAGGNVENLPTGSLLNVK